MDERVDPTSDAYTASIARLRASGEDIRAKIEEMEGHLLQRLQDGAAAMGYELVPAQPKKPEKQKRTRRTKQEMLEAAQ